MKCNSCKYYYASEEYCTFLKRDTIELNILQCPFYETGAFDCRFYIQAIQTTNNNYQYILIDLDGELTDLDNNYMTFAYEEDVDIICEFLNKNI